MQEEEKVKWRQYKARVVEELQSNRDLYAKDTLMRL